MKKLISFGVLLFTMYTTFSQSRAIAPPNARVDPTIGISYSTSNLKSVWLTLGSDFFFVYQLGASSSPDKTTYHPFLDSTETKYWNDQQLSDIVKTLNWSVGVGTVIQPGWSVFADTGIAKITIRYQFVDETRTLSKGNGLYSFPKKVEGAITCNVGTIFSISDSIRGKASVAILGKTFQQFEIGAGVRLF